MSFMSDGISEFRKLPKGGKIAVAAALVGVAGLGYIEYRKSKSTSAGLSTSASPSTDTQAAQSSQLPFLPFGSTALTDSSGTPFAFVNPPSSTPTSTPTPTPTNSAYTPLLSSLPANFPKW